MACTISSGHPTQLAIRPARPRIASEAFEIKFIARTTRQFRIVDEIPVALHKATDRLICATGEGGAPCVDNISRGGDIRLDRHRQDSAAYRITCGTRASAAVSRWRIP